MIHIFIQNVYCTLDIHIANIKLRVLYSNCQCSLTPTSHPVLKTTWSLNQIAFKAIDIMSLRQLDVHIVRPLNVHVSILHSRSTLFVLSIKQLRYCNMYCLYLPWHPIYFGSISLTPARQRPHKSCIGVFLWWNKVK